MYQSSATYSGGNESTNSVPLIQARSCTPRPGCWCNKVQGQFCGNPSVNPDCLAGHVYECNENTGRTCDYGVRESCVQCGQLSC